MKTIIIIVVGVLAFSACNNKNQNEVKPISTKGVAKIKVKPTHNQDKSGPDDDESPVIHGLEVTNDGIPVIGEKVNLYNNNIKIDSTETDSNSQFQFVVSPDVYHLEVEIGGEAVYETDTFTVQDDVNVYIEF